MTAMATPITPAEAEKLAIKAVGDYLTACNLQTEDRELIGNLLMKLISVAGIAMANAEGRDTAAQRLRGTAAFVMKAGAAHPKPLVRIQ